MWAGPDRHPSLATPGPAWKEVNPLLNLIQALMTQLRSREEGQTFVEYALVIGGVSLLLLAAFSGLPGAVTTFVTNDIVGKL
jgi:Flp pilus assembly pilin Flp